MRRKAAVDLNAEMARRRAQVFLARPCRRRIRRSRSREIPPPACRPHVRIGPRLLDHTRDLVAERERQRAARRHVELLVAAEAEIAVVQMQVGMAHAAATDPHQHLGAVRLRRFDHRLAQRRRVGGHRLADHAGHAIPLRARRNLPPQYPPRARSGRSRRFRAAEWDRRRAASGFAATSCGAGRTPPRSRAPARGDRRAGVLHAARTGPATR